MYRSETGRPDEGYAGCEENGEELERIRKKVKEKSYEENDERVKKMMQREKIIKTRCVKVKQSHYRPGQALRGSRRLRLPYFKTISTRRLSALRTGRLYPPGNIPGTHFC